jgi:hypothetical protein
MVYFSKQIENCKDRIEAVDKDSERAGNGGKN